MFNHVGTIDVIIDIVAYTLPSSGTTNRITTAQVATKSWNLNPDTPAVINLPATTQNPYGMAFDGTNIWTANRYDSNVTRINPVTGVATTFPLPAGATWADHLAFDGTNIWTANTSTNNVTRFDVNTGAGTNFPLPAGAMYPEDILFDGTNLWTANATSHNLTMITPATGAATNLPLVAVTSGPRYLGFDGINVWASKQLDAIRVNLSTLVETNFSMPVPIEGFAFDGTYLWAGHVGTTVVRVDINTGIGTAVPMPTGANSCEFAYDGQDMYGVCGSTGPNVLKFDTGFAAGEVLMGDASPWGVVYDGSHIWVNTNATGGQPARIVRLPASH